LSQAQINHCYGVSDELNKYPELEKLLGKYRAAFIIWRESQRVLYVTDIRQDVYDFLQIWLPYQGKRKRKKQKRGVKCQI
jgi:hypothetical protein